MRILNLALICLILAGATVGYAGEALVSRVRGSKLTIDVGAEAGLTVGMAVTVVRPPGESIVHPVTGENLGAPEIEIGRGTITRISDRVASVQLEGNLLLTVRPGDVARFVTPEEDMIMDQERQIASEERNQQDHQEFRSELSRLARSIKDVQGRIGSLESLVKRVERVEEGFRVQLQGLHKDMNEMKGDIKSLKEQVALYGPVPVSSPGEKPQGSEALTLTPEDVEQIVRKVMGDGQTPLQQPSPLQQSSLQQSPPLQQPSPLQQSSLQQPPPLQQQPEPATEELPPLPDDDLSLEPEIPQDPFYKQSWFLYGLLGALGIVGVTAFLAMRMMAGGEEDEEEEDEDEELEEDEEGVEIEVEEEEEEEEDDIVVEETS